MCPVHGARPSVQPPVTHQEAACAESATVMGWVLKVEDLGAAL